MASEQETRRVRGSTQRLYLLEEQQDGSEFLYDVMGTTRNVYNIHLRDDRSWTCTCPDYKKRSQHCKHIYFVQDRVLDGAEDVVVRALERITAMHERTLEYASDSLREQYNEKKRRRDERETATVKQRPYAGEACAICLEEMTADCTVTWCRQSCGNTIHKDCYDRWTAKRRDNCPFCRQPLQEQTASSYIQLD